MGFRAVLLGLLLPGLLLAAETKKGPKQGSYYKWSQVGIQKQEIKGTELHLTFKPVAEQFFWCPGVKTQVTKKATIVTFVRCSVLNNCAVDKKAAIGNRLIRTLKIDTKGLDTFVLDGPQKYRRIYQTKQSKIAEQKKKKAAKPQLISNDPPAGKP